MAEEYTRPGLVELIRFLWTYGDAWSRRFTLLYISGIAGMAGGTIWLAWTVFTGRLPETVFFSYVLTEPLAGLVCQGICLPSYSIPLVRERLRRGWTKPEERAYCEEFARYTEEAGVRGRPRGEVAWGLAAVVVFWTILVAPVIVALVLLPTTGPTTPLYSTGLAIGLGLVYYVASVIRFRKLMFEAEKLGYRLIQLHPRSAQNRMSGRGR